MSKKNYFNAKSVIFFELLSYHFLSLTITHYLLHYINSLHHSQSPQLLALSNRTYAYRKLNTLMHRQTHTQTPGQVKLEPGFLYEWSPLSVCYSCIITLMTGLFYTHIKTHSQTLDTHTGNLHIQG